MSVHPYPLRLGLLVALAACSASGPPDDPVGQGTEIGDEGGGWTCLEDTSSVDDASAEIDALGSSPESLFAETTGAYEGEEAELGIAADAGAMTWFDNEVYEYDTGEDTGEDAGEAECLDFLYVGALVTVAMSDLDMETAIAGLTYAEDGSVSFRAAALAWQGDLREDPDDDEGGSDGDSSYWEDNSSLSTTLEPSTFVMEEMFTVQLVLDGVFVGGEWALELWWMAETYPEGEDGTVSSYEETLWSGSVAAASE